MSKRPNAPDPTAIGEVSAPPFVRLPDPMQIFVDRTLRLRALADGSEIAPFLQFLASLTELQYRVQDGLPEPLVPDAPALRRSRERAMPALDRTDFRRDGAFDQTLAALLRASADIAMPEPARKALDRVAAMEHEARDGLLAAVLANDAPRESVAESVYLAAAAQVHFSRLASRLDVTEVAPVGHGVCPCCGSPPACSMVVGWPGAYGSRFCCCALCGTLWNFVRINCVLCGSSKGIGYQEVEGKGGTAKAETCDNCHRYVKILYQTGDHGIEPIADDVATLGLDILMSSGLYRRGGVNPFLLGY